MSSNQPQSSSLAHRVVPLIAAIALAVCASQVLAATARADFSEYGIASVDASLSTRQAGAHPDVTTTIKLKQDPDGMPIAGQLPPFARTRDITVDLPAGLTGNPNVIPQCTVEEFQTALSGAFTGGGCPQDSQVGVVDVHGIYGQFFPGPIEPLYSLKPPNRNVVARLGFWAVLFPVFIDIHVRSETDYGLTASLNGMPAQAGLFWATTTLWGVPAAASHDTQRMTPIEALFRIPVNRPSGLAPRPFMTNPTRCGVSQQVDFAAASYPLPNQISRASAPLPETTGCDRLDFDPRLSVSPASATADSPTGLDVDLELRQDDNVNTLSTAHLRDATVTLPAGMAIAPGAADGLQVCSARQVRMGTQDPAGCPEASKIGTAQFDVPALPGVLHGAIYQRKPAPGRLLRIWLVADDFGVHLKLPGEVHADTATGQLTTTFEDNPQVPVSELKLHFKGGPRGVLVTPPSCGSYVSESVLTPWSAPQSGPPASPSDSFHITSGPGGGPCPTNALAPELHAGLVNPVAGSQSPFVLHLSRPDGTQRISSLTTVTPPGVAAYLRGIPYCPEAAIAAAGRRGGAAERAAPSCPAASRVGTVSVGAGAGPSPFYVPGSAYLAGPYKGAPLSLVIVTPALAGPFDLGDVVVRAAVFVDPQDAHLRVVSDPIPQILKGIPLDVRDIRIAMDRPGFMVAPTSCDQMQVKSTVLGASAARAELANRFQVGGCASLGFEPKLRFRVKGGKKATRRNSHPELRARVSYPPSQYGEGGAPQANISRAAVTLPKGMFLDQDNLSTICTRAQYAAEACPENTRVGSAIAQTPLLDEPLEGPVYLIGSENKLPDLIADLNGIVDIDLRGKIDSRKNRIRNDFQLVPDVPVSQFDLTIDGGRKKGLLVNSHNICNKRKYRKANVKIEAQNGDSLHDGSRIRGGKCGKKKGKGNGKGHGHHGGGADGGAGHGGHGGRDR